MTIRVLLTGGFGYVGGRVAQRLASDERFEVILGSRKLRNRPEWLSSASVLKTDWSSVNQLHGICEQVDAVIHLAAMNEIEAAKDPVGALEMNGVASIRLLEAAIRARVKRFIYLSTAHVYGAALKGKVTELTLPQPRHPYATSHRAAEDSLLAAHSDGRIEAVVVRLSNSYGAPSHRDVDRWTLLVNDLCRQAVCKKTLVLRSAGLQRRDFVTLKDVAEGIRHLLTLPSTDLLKANLFNLGGAWAPSVIEMALLVANRCALTLGYQPDIERPDPDPLDMAEPLDYSIDRLIGSGFRLTGDPCSELDACLKFCKVTFADGKAS